MANVTLIFYGTERSKTDDTELKAFSNRANEMYISIEDDDYPPNHICLDKKTAIKLSRELRKQIALLDD